MSLSCTELMGIWFVDDCDLITMAPYCPGEAIWDEAQESLDSWAGLLHSTGGALKGEKCFWYPIEYVWNNDGSWSYGTDIDRELSIPLFDGRREVIAKLGVNDSRKTLGVFSCPSGRSTAHIQYINDQARRWSCKLLNSALPAKWAWISYSMQLWPSLRYGLGTLSASLAQLRSALPKFAFTILPKLGVNRHIRKGWRHLHQSFCGLGMFSLPIESAICRVNLFLQHWGNPTPIGESLRCSMELLQLETGLESCPLHHDFRILGPLCTRSWLRSFWECISWFKISLSLDYPPTPLPAN
jgi:hypothetical protein